VAAILLALMGATGTGSVGGPAAPAPGASFYAIGEPGTGLAIGDRPPPFARVDEEPVRDLDGQVLEPTAFRGQPLWVIFWATWCPPCQQETPDVQRAWKANSQSGLQIIAIDVQEPADVAREYAQTYGLTYRIATDPTGSAFRNWTVFGLPTHYFIDRDGVIRDRWFGPMTLDEMQSRIDTIASR
jgi:cytochrome c biogenesis protein CcmG/thiol:disulfide interchange protein DsbE